MADKPLSWSEHAEDSLGERELERDWIEQTARDPDWTAPDRQHPDRKKRFKAIPAYDNRILRVVVVESPTEIRIVTAFFDRKARRP